MEFSISKDVFVKALGGVCGVADKNTNHPVLENVLIVADGDKVVVAATNLEVLAVRSCPADIKKDGSITVPAKKLYEIVKEAPESELKFKLLDDGRIEIKSGKAKFVVVGIAPDDFPDITQVAAYLPPVAPALSSKLISVDSGMLGEMIDGVFTSICHDNTKYNLNGVFLHVVNVAEQSHLKMVATDGHRLASISRPFGASVSAEMNTGIILPEKGVSELKKFLDGSPSPVYIGFSDNWATFGRGNSAISMRLVDGDYPDYGRVIPKNNTNILNVSRDAMTKALRRIILLSDEKEKGISLAISDCTVRLSCGNSMGDANESFEALYSGPDISLKINARYVLDTLASSSEPSVTFAFNDSATPVIITDNVDPFFLGIIMPMRN